MRKVTVFKALKISVIVIIMLQAMTFVANAATKTWVPTAGGAWTTAANWSPSGVPVANDDVIINANQSAAITAVPTIALHSLTINGNCTLQSAAAVTLTLGGNAAADFVIASGKTLTLGTTVNITMAASATATITGALTLGAGVTFNTAGTSVVTTVTGTINNSGTVTGSATGLVFSSGSNYYHAENGGVIPTATWSDGSTCNITGIVATVVDQLSLGQSFYNLTWNCPNQTWNPTTGSTTVGSDYKIRGTFTFANSGTGSNIWPALNCSVANYVHTGGLDRLSYQLARDHTIGNFSVSGGTADFSQSTGTPVINISGDISITGGSLITSGTGGATINLVGPGVQTFTGGGTFTGGTGFKSWNILNGAIVDFGTSVLGGNVQDTFRLKDGGGIITAHADGIETSGNVGSIQVGGPRIFSSVADYTYDGVVAQSTGGGLPGIVRNLTLSNHSVVTLRKAETVTSVMTINNGGIANLSTFTNYTPNLTLETTSNTTGIWGSSASPASNVDDTYFSSTTGVVVV